MFRIVDDAYVTLADGELKPLRELELGDWVRGENSINKVMAVRKSLEKEPYFKHGDLPPFTATQLFKSGAEWMCLAAAIGRATYPSLIISQMKDGDVLRKDGVAEPIELEEVLPEAPEEFIEITLDGDHSYYLNGYLVHNGGGGSKQPSDTTQTIEPPTVLRPFIRDIAIRAHDAFEQVPQGGFEGDFIAPVDPLQQEALGQQEAIARGLSGFGNDTNAIASQQAQRVLSGDILAPLQERFTPTSALDAGVYDAAIAPVRETLLEDIIPGIQSQAIQQGAFGGSRQDVVTGQALDDFSEEALRITTALGAQDHARMQDQLFQDLLSTREFGAELEKINQAAALTVPELQNQGLQQDLLGASLLGEVGQAQRLFGQDAIDNAYQQYVHSTQAPFVGLDQYAALVNGLPAGSTTTVSGGGRSSSSPVGGAIAGGLGGVSLGSALGLAPLGPAGIALGLGGSLLGGLFS